jgi:hypothetical protein
MNFRNVSSQSFAIVMILASYGPRSHDTSGVQAKVLIVLQLNSVYICTHQREQVHLLYADGKKEAAYAVQQENR